MDDLEVNSELSTIVIDDEDADAAATIVEGLGKTLEQTALVKDRKTLLDIAGLGHSDDTVILTDVQDTVLLEDRAEHVLDDDRGRRVGDEGRLLMELLGEEVHTQVAVLTGLGGGGDADDLARAALEDQEIANADVVAGDGDGVGRSHGFDGGLGTDTFDGNTRGDAGGRDERRGGGGVLFLDYDLFAGGADVGSVGRVGRVRVGVVVVVVLGTVDGVENAISSFVETVAERMIVSVFVVISHITLELLLLDGCLAACSTSLGRITRVYKVDLAAADGGSVGSPGRVTFLNVLGWLTEAWLGSEVGRGLLNVAGRSSYDRSGAFAELTLRDVNLGGSVLGRGRT
jgi:hypothetical protein